MRADCVALGTETEDEPDGGDEAEGGGDVVPTDLHVESEHREDDEHAEGDDLLDDFELHDGEGAAMLDETEAVGGDLEAILEESDGPAEGDDADEGEVLEPLVFIELEVPIPGESHEDVAANEQQNTIKTFHMM